MSNSRFRAPFVHSNNVQSQLQQAMAFHQSGKLPEAEQLYRAVLKQAPRHYDALHFYGVLYCQRGQFEEALESIGKAIAINPGFPDAYLNRGIALHELQRYEEAVASYDRSIKLKPANPEALFNRGNSLRMSKRYQEAVTSFELALRFKPEFPEALLNLGNALQHLNRYAEALACYEKALAYSPQSIAALISYSHLQSYLGQPEIALRTAMRALSVADTIVTRAAFFNIVKGLVFTHHQSEIEPLLIRALSEPWGRPYELLAPVTSLIKLSPVIQACMARAVKAWPQKLNASELFTADSLHAVADSKMLLCLLQNCQCCDADLEKFLSSARYALLLLARSGTSCDEATLGFFCALAQQCFINEYVYDCDDAEAELAQQMQYEIDSSLMQGLQAAPMTVLAVASYFPLYTLSTAKKLLDFVWTDAINCLLQQQIIQPVEESQYQDGIPQVTAIRDEVSLSVQHQYEENPYPRWVKYAPQSEKVSVDDYLSREFPRASVHPVSGSAGIDILIAGCGTGTQAIDVATNFLGAKVLAVDLSRPSLGYAVRKTHELGISNIEYAQADILEIGSIGRSFDVVESVGVLHHLQNPLQGLRELVKLLKPNGLMKLGFYSELARSGFAAARELIAQKGYAANAADIRKLRSEILSAQEAGKFASVIGLRDFYTLGECRDLLFHVQEHRFTIPALQQMLKHCGLVFLGFQLSAHVLKRYAERFPADSAKNDLDNWNTFETENPATFIGMYQFWVQKKETGLPELTPQLSSQQADRMMQLG